MQIEAERENELERGDPRRKPFPIETDTPRHVQSLKYRADLTDLTITTDIVGPGLLPLTTYYIEYSTIALTHFPRQNVTSDTICCLERNDVRRWNAE